MLELDLFFKKKFIKKIQKIYQMKNYDKLLFNFNKTAEQYDKLLKSYNSYQYLTNKKGFNIINKLNRWWCTKKIKLLKEKVSLAQARIRVVERKICFEVLSLYFENDYLDGKVVYFFEYQKWVETFIRDFEDKIDSNLKDIIRTLFTDTFRDEIFQRKNGVKFINAENSMEKFIYETANSKEVLNFQTSLTNFKIISKQYEKEVKQQELILQKIDLKIQKITELLEKNEIIFEKLKNSWFFNTLKSKIIRRKNEKLKTKIEQMLNLKNILSKKLEKIYSKGLDNLKLKKAEFNLSSKILIFYLTQKNDKNLNFSEYEAWKTQFMITCEKVIRKFALNACKVAIVNNFAETLFKDILSNIKFQEELQIKVVNNDNDLSSLQKMTTESFFYDNEDNNCDNKGVSLYNVKKTLNDKLLPNIF